MTMSKTMIMLAGSSAQAQASSFASALGGGSTADALAQASSQASTTIGSGEAFAQAAAEAYASAEPGTAASSAFASAYAAVLAQTAGTSVNAAAQAIAQSAAGKHTALDPMTCQSLYTKKVSILWPAGNGSSSAARAILLLNIFSVHAINFQ